MGHIEATGILQPGYPKSLSQYHERLLPKILGESHKKGELSALAPALKKRAGNPLWDKCGSTGELIGGEKKNIQAAWLQPFLPCLPR